MPCSMNEIYPGLWIGDIHSSQNKELLIQNGITCVINCTVSVPFCDLPQIRRRIRVSIKDDLSPTEIYKMYLSLDKLATTIFKSLPHHKILVHCYAGAQRSVTAVTAFFMKYTTLSIDTILRCIQSKRGSSDGRNFDQALLHYYCDLNKLEREFIKGTGAK